MKDASTSSVKRRSVRLVLEYSNATKEATDARIRLTWPSVDFPETLNGPLEVWLEDVHIKLSGATPSSRLFHVELDGPGANTFCPGGQTRLIYSGLIPQGSTRYLSHEVVNPEQGVGFAVSNSWLNAPLRLSFLDEDPGDVLPALLSDLRIILVVAERS